MSWTRYVDGLGRPIPEHNRPPGCTCLRRRHSRQRHLRGPTRNLLVRLPVLGKAGQEGRERGLAEILASLRALRLWRPVGVADMTTFETNNVCCPVCGELFEETGYAVIKPGVRKCWHGPVNTADLVERILTLEERVERLDQEHQSQDAGEKVAKMLRSAIVARDARHGGPIKPDLNAPFGPPPNRDPYDYQIPQELIDELVRDRQEQIGVSDEHE